MIAYLGIDAEPCADAMPVTILRILDGPDPLVARGYTLAVDLLVAIAQVASRLDLGRPVGTLDLGDLVGGHRGFLAQVLCLRLQVIGLRIAPVDQRLELGVLGLELRVGGLETIQPLREGL